MSETLARSLPPLCVALPLIAAAVLAPLSKYVPRTISSIVTTLTTLAVFIISCGLVLYTSAHGPVVHWMGGWLPRGGLAIGIDFSVDTMSAGLSAFVSLLVLMALIYTWVCFDLAGTLFHALLLAFLAAMCGYALTGDLFDMFVWFELMTGAAIALTAHKIEESESIECAINLGVTNTIAGFIVLLGIGFIYGRTGALNLAQLGVVLSQRPADTLVIVSLALVTAGYFVKGAVAPFHFWLDDAHAVAPTPVCILFSGIMVQLALYGVARIYWTVFSPALSGHTHALQQLFLVVGVVTALVGAIMAFAQRHLKRLLAFSTVSHSGMFVAALGLLSAGGVAAAAMFVLGHGLIKSALFICAGNYLNRFRSLDEEVLGGKGKGALANSIVFLIGGLALATLPPFALSTAKSLYDAVMKEHGLMWIAFVMGFASAIDGGAVLRAGIHITFGIGKPQKTGFSPREEEPETRGPSLDRTPWPMLTPAFVLLAVALWAGSSHSLQRGIATAAHAFVDQPAYASTVMRGTAERPRTASPAKTTGEDMAINVAVSVAAIIAAFIGLFRDHIPEHLRPIFGPPLRELRGMHSGIFTDYVAYVMVGIAVYSGWLCLATR